MSVDNVIGLIQNERMGKLNRFRHMWSQGRKDNFPVVVFFVFL